MLTSKQRAELRAQSNGLETTLMVGKEGVTEQVVAQAEAQLLARELIKGRVLENSMYTAREAAEELAVATRSEVVQVIGSKFVLYRETHSKPKEKRIALVRDSKRKPN